ncbi:molybdopterin-dependent oxidoreductase [Hyperthermus butylicus]|uniref:Sulfite oxidase n=1 Tax=Hyperthermus butylicus (strain DSM 5456 / JCM 9403 / PLM1-5) TaxID=415426 RepID=A2BK16_HYPBU|nr:molybdopterin-dependent oxidoreductase [Hyperthermus butylicus]ABM80327.1 Sulfite oxidase [Hyperthermus butylicus DSM 5456]
MPAEVHGCRVYLNRLAAPEPIVVADCTVTGKVGARGEAHAAIEGLLRLLDHGLGLKEALEATGYSVEPLARRRFTVHSAPLRGGGEARVVEARGVVLTATAVLPVSLMARVDDGVRERLEKGAVLRIGEAVEPPVYLSRPVLEPGDGEPAGQKAIPRFVTYAAEGPPEAVPSNATIRVYTPRGITVIDQGILGETAEWLVLDMHCVTGWSVRGKRWLAAPLREVLRLAGAEVPSGGWLLARSAGGYASIVPLQEALEYGYIAIGLEGKQLDRDRGAPARLVLPRLYGWKHTKWLTEIHLLEGYTDGYWEAKGYHERGLVALEERFKIRNLELIDVTEH